VIQGFVGGRLGRWVCGIKQQQPLHPARNTMPVQQAEAMEQLLRQVGDSGVCGWAAGRLGRWCVV
jgi:hypothetical protein